MKQIPETVQLRLSDSYYREEKEPALEVKVTMLNLNAGNNRKLMESCRTLKEYMLYVERVRSYAERPELTLEMVVERAVEECIKENILSDFLRRNRAEAVYMSIFEYDEEKELALIRKDEYETGKREGITEGIAGIVLRMLSAGTYSLEEISSISGLSVEAIGEMNCHGNKR